MKKLFLLIMLLLIKSYSYSQELMNFYIEPNGDNEVILNTLVHNWQFSSFGSSSISYLDNTITVSLCYLNTVAQEEVYDYQSYDISLPEGHSTYILQVDLYGDGDATLPCSLSNQVDIGVISFDYPYDNTATTTIPDNVFEGYIEDLGFGDDITNNDLVFTHRIENLTNIFLNIISEDIFSLEGLEDFKELKRLRCNGHQISDIDTSQNLKLEQFWCHNNPINQLDVSNNVNLIWLEAIDMNLSSLNVNNNINLEILHIQQNKLTTIDVSQNINLKDFSITTNNIENLDITNNIALEYLGCGMNLLTTINTTNNINLKELYIENSNILEINISNNSLLEILISYSTNLIELDLSYNINIKEIIIFDNQINLLNIKNGNNENLETLLTFDSPNLFCIEVDDVEYANNASDWNVDDWTSFSEDCSFGVNDFFNESFTLLPNPVSNILTIDNTSSTQIISVKIYDVLGRLVLHEKEQFNSIDVSHLKSGLLFVQLETEQGRITKKVVKE
ncbi:T9SS type A sorting domain-containing protein [Candidatus Marifrigoribacter sp. Uisw_064]|jgi:hypothetical protein|uniref:T9SS type A sorting domain-containing protein n=1 Tax=Candidatus Marifrigoribacter sp. Uisw_064 TaxID=3230970 RepID=UPI003D44D4BE